MSIEPGCLVESKRNREIKLHHSDTEEVYAWNVISLK